MERDKQLQEILVNNTLRASADFTDAVMQKVNGLASVSLFYQPLVSPALKRLFVYTFAALITAIIALCLIIGFFNLHVLDWIRNRALPDLNYRKILVFILTFWVVFTVNRLLEKKVFYLRRFVYK